MTRSNMISGFVFIATVVFFTSISIYGGLSSLKSDPLTGDRTHYAESAHNLANYSVFSLRTDPASTKKPYMRREPGYSALLAVSFAETLRTTDIDCLLQGSEPSCEALRRSMSAVSVYSMAVVLIIASVAVAFLTGSLLAGGATAFVLSTAAWVPIDQMSETLAAPLLILHAASLASAYKTGRGGLRLLLIAVSALALGALVLTKAVFLYWYVLLAIGATVLLIRRRDIWKTVLLVLVLPVLVIGPWIARNYSIFNELKVANRSGEMLYLRAAYLDMEWEQYLDGYVSYAPTRQLRQLLERYISSEDAELFQNGTKGGFYDRGKRHGRKFPNQTARNNELGAEAKEKILAEPLKFLAQGVLFAYRGAFPRYTTYQAEGSARSYFNLSQPVVTMMLYFGTLSILLAFAIALVRRHYEFVLLLAPAVFSLLIHAAASDGLRRYSAPTNALMAVSIVFLIYLAISAIASRFGSSPGSDDLKGNN